MHSLALNRTKIKQHKRILKKDPSSIDARLKLGILYFKGKEYEKSLSHLLAAKTDTKENPAVLNMLGLVYFHTGRYKEAQETLAGLLEDGATNPEALETLAQIYVRENNFSEAMKCLEASLKIYPSRAESWNDLGALCFARQDYYQAEHNFRKALACETQHALSRENLISLLMEMGRLQEAKEAAEEYIAIFVEDFRGYKLLGLACEREGDLKKALQCFSQARQLEPKDPEILYHLGVCSMSLDDAQSAIDHFSACLALDNKHASARERLTACYCKIEGANKAYRILKQSFPERVENHLATNQSPTASSRKKLSVLLPAFNESDKILSNLREIKNTLVGLGHDFEIIVVDDGSDDDTYPIAELLSRSIKEVSVYQSSKNIGKGMALREAALKAEGELIVFLDADLELHPRLIADMMARMEREQADLVLGSKRHTESKLDYPWHRKMISDLYYVVNHILFGIPVKDTQTGIKLFKRKVLEDVLPKLIEKKYAFDLELIVNAHAQGFKIIEAPITLNYSRKKGRIGLFEVYRTALDTLAIFYRLKILKYYDFPRPQLLHYPACSIIIAFKDSGDYLKESVEHCLSLDYPNFEIILLPDQDMDLKYPGVRVIATGPIPPSAKRDLGAKAATGEILCFLDDDAYPRKEWLKRLVRNLCRPEVGAVGGPAVTPESDDLAQKLSGTIFSSFLVSGGYTYRYMPMAYREVDDYPTCNLAVKRADFEQIGGFDTRYWPGEDTILCLKITRQLGKKIVYDPEALVYHHRRRLFSSHLRQVKSYALHRGFFAKRFPENSLRVAYFVPSLFVAFLVFGLVASLMQPALWAPYAGILGFYFLLAMTPSLLSFKVKQIVLTAAGVFLTHITYGVYFLKGILSRSLAR